MEPVAQTSLVFCLWVLESTFFIFLINFLNLLLWAAFLLSLLKFKKTLRHNCGAVRNTSNLSSEIVLLFAKEEWISDDVSLKVSSEQNFNLSSSVDVLRCKIWQLHPLSKGVVTDPIDKFIDTASPSFEVWSSFLTIVFSFQ